MTLKITWKMSTKNVIRESTFYTHIPSHLTYIRTSQRQKIRDFLFLASLSSLPQASSQNLQGVSTIVNIRLCKQVVCYTTVQTHGHGNSSAGSRHGSQAMLVSHVCLGSTQQIWLTLASLCCSLLSLASEHAIGCSE